MQETVGSRIKALALQQALRESREPPKAQALASALGVSYESLRKWAAGKTAPNRARAEKIAAYLGCPIESFMLGVRFALSFLGPSPGLRIGLRNRTTTLFCCAHAFVVP